MADSMIEKYALVKVIKSVIRERCEFGIRETARKAKISASAAKEALDFLLAQNILEKRKLGRNLLFKVKLSFIAKEIKILYSLSEINSSRIAEEIAEKNAGVISIAVYGSVAAGEDDDKSDIDLLVISRKKINVAALRGEKLLGRELAIINYTYKEWVEKAEKDRAFYHNVILNCIPLYGEKPAVI